MQFSAAENLISRCVVRSRELARIGLQSTIADLYRDGFHVRSAGVLLGSGRRLPELEKILASHALIHAAEGEMYRNILVDAISGCGIGLFAVKEKEKDEEAALRFRDLKLSEKQVESYLRSAGRDLGPPWREDQKLATMVAWLALAAALGAPSTGASKMS